MDDIAKSAGISKKTVYQFFTGKDEILSSVVQQFLLKHKQSLERCSKQSKDAVEEVVYASHLFVQTMNSINQNFFYDLEKSFPGVWQAVADYRKKSLVPSITRNLKKGIAQELYREDLNVSFTADIRMQQIMTAFTPALFTQDLLHGNKLMMQLSEFYLHGIASLKGKKMINKYLNVHNEYQF
jgi:TetR/AcrR family transcriptional regulator, cholesterol catabolism regulator